MKLRSKLLLSATCLLTISVAATATSAYAWFTANRQASIAITQANVRTNATNLKIAGVTKTDEDTTTLTADPNNKSAANGDVSVVKVTDISGDGVTFFNPRLAPDFGVDPDGAEGTGTPTYNAVSISKVKNSATNKYYHQFKLSFSQDNADVNTGVFLDTGSTVVETVGSTTNIQKAVRVAFLDSSGDLLLYWAPNETEESINKFYLSAETTKTTDISDKAGDCKTAISTIEAKTIIGSFTNVTDATNNKVDDKSHLVTLNGTKANTITIRIWFEGMDSDCVSTITAGQITANLKFNGVNMDI